VPPGSWPWRVRAWVGPATRADGGALGRKHMLWLLAGRDRPHGATTCIDGSYTPVFVLGRAQSTARTTWCALGGGGARLNVQHRPRERLARTCMPARADRTSCTAVSARSYVDAICASFSV
jgi:hypothetical protein